MAIWIIGGSAVLGAWALLSVLGGELTRRTQALQAQYKGAAARAKAREH